MIVYNIIEDHGSPGDPILPVTSRCIICDEVHQEAGFGPLKQTLEWYSAPV